MGRSSGYIYRFVQVFTLIVLKFACTLLFKIDNKDTSGKFSRQSGTGYQINAFNKLLSDEPSHDNTIDTHSLSLNKNGKDDYNS